MTLDIRTLLIAVALATAFNAGARLLLWRMHPALPGLGLWAAAGCVATLALGVLFLTNSVPWLPSKPLAQLGIGLGLLLTWDGFRRFAERPPLSPATWVMLLSIILIATLAEQHAQSLRVQAMGNASVIAGLSALIARELLSAAQPLQLAMRATGWIFAANAAFFVFRAITIGNGAGPVGPLNPDGLAAFALLWWLGLAMAITLGMVLMTGERLQSDLDAQVHRDPLTGALNRRAFSLVAQNAISRARRHGKPLSIMMLDLDNFKHINDRHGHDTGDSMLCRFVDLAGKILRGQDVFCRFGGEEFVALLPDTSAERAMLAAERLRAAFEELEGMQTSNGTMSSPVTVSIGIGELAAGEDMASLLRRADAALYRAKELGRNRSELSRGGLAPDGAEPLGS